MTRRSARMGALAALAAIAIGAWAMRPKPAVKPPLSGSSQTEHLTAADDKVATPAPTVKAAPPAPTLADGRFAMLGSVQSEEQITVSARMPARIARVAVREGDLVRVGELLVQLDDGDLAAQARTAEAGIDAARAQLNKARLGADSAVGKADADLLQARGAERTAAARLRQAVLSRAAALMEGKVDLNAANEGIRKAQIAYDEAVKNLDALEELDKVGGVARSQLDGARAQVAVARADLETANDQERRAAAGPQGPDGDQTYRVALAEQDVRAAQAGVAEATAELKLAEQNEEQERQLGVADIGSAAAALQQAIGSRLGAEAMVKGARLTSPIDGVVSNVSARAGETAQPGMNLVSVVSLRGLHVEALVPSRQIDRLHVGDHVRITVETVPGRAFDATVRSIGRTAEPDGRTFKVKFALTDRAVPLRPGQMARITFTNGG